MPVDITITQKDLELLMPILREQAPEIDSGSRTTPKLLFDSVDTLTVYSDEIAQRIGSIMADKNWRTSGKKKILKTYAADARWRKETAGITVDGVFMPTDRDSQQSILTHAAVSNNPAMHFHWKMPDGQFVELGPSRLSMMASAVSRYVQRCRSMEATVVESVMAETITSTAQIDAAFSKITA